MYYGQTNQNVYPQANQFIFLLVLLSNLLIVLYV